MNENSLELMREALRLTQAGRLQEASAVIQRVLNAATGVNAATATTPPAGGQGDVFESSAHILPAAPPAPAQTAAPASQGEPPQGDPPERDPPQVDPPQAPPPAAPDDADLAARPGAGEFVSGKYTHALQTRHYKLFIPAGVVGRPQPLVVMLHGCTQDPDDFAAGTGMNQRAREQGFFVLYPAQSKAANPSRCWNWFMREHQRRGGGEPASLAGLTQAVIEDHGIDRRRVFIAGLSAGGAMAAILASEYPEIFAAVGVHSGLAQGAASDMAGAFTVMKSGVSPAGSRAMASRVGISLSAAPQPTTLPPAIVFHGDADRTVHPRNGEQVIAAALSRGGAARSSEASAFAAGAPSVEQGVSAQGTRYTRSTHFGASGDAVAEHWLVHGAGHAWSGGRAAGSFTDATGPDATGEMLRFFFAHPRGGAT